MFHEVWPTFRMFHLSLLLFPNVRPNIITSRMVRSQAGNEASDKKVKTSYFLKSCFVKYHHCRETTEKDELWLQFICSFSTSIFDIWKKLLEIKTMSIAVLYLKYWIFNSRCSSDYLTTYWLLQTIMQTLDDSSSFVQSDYWTVVLLGCQQLSFFSSYTQLLYVCSARPMWDLAYNHYKFNRDKTNSLNF